VPRRVDHAQRRRQIGEALLRIAHTRGLQAASMREVAAEAGVSLRLVQYYFHTKEDCSSERSPTSVTSCRPG
jgi:AcrR family transcriptional regulator